MYRRLVTAIAMCALTGFLSASAFAQQTDAKDDAKKAGEETKDAGKSTAEATKDAGKAAGKATKAAAKKTAQVSGDAAKETATGTKKAAKTAKKKVTPNTTSATCKDGTVQTGKTKTTACVDHGGVQG